MKAMTRWGGCKVHLSSPTKAVTIAWAEFEGHVEVEAITKS